MGAVAGGSTTGDSAVPSEKVTMELSVNDTVKIINEYDYRGRRPFGFSLFHRDEASWPCIDRICVVGSS